MLKVAIIGTGNISNFHIKGYMDFPERCIITRLVDIFPEKAEQKKKDYGLSGAEVFDSHKKILDDPDVDLVSICTPPYCHAEIAIDFLNAGKNVIVEKPMAASLEECDAMNDAAEKSGKVFSVIAQNRFCDPVMNVKNILDNGMIGRVLHAQVDSHWWRGHCYYDLWWRGCWEKEGGGCTLNHAVHQIDQLGWMLGLPESVCSMISNAGHDNSEVEDISVAVMQYGKGTLAQVTSSVIHHGEGQGISLQGEKASISAPWSVHASLAKDNGFPYNNDAYEKELGDYYDSLPKLEHTAHTGQIDNVMTAIAQGTEPLIKGCDGRLTIELITAIYKAGIEKRTVSLPITKDDVYYKLEGIHKNAPHFFEKTTSETNVGGESITVGSGFETK